MENNEQNILGVKNKLQRIFSFYIVILRALFLSLSGLVTNTLCLLFFWSNNAFIFLFEQMTISVPCLTFKDHTEIKNRADKKKKNHESGETI